MSSLSVNSANLYQKETQSTSEPKRQRSLKRLWDYLYRYKWLLFLAAVLSMAANLLALIGPMLCGYAIDAIQPGPGNVQFQKVFFNCALMLFFYILSSLLSYGISLLMLKLSQKVVYQLRKDIFTKLSVLPVGYFDQHQTGDIISRISYDVDTINTSLASDVIQVLSSIVTVVGSLVMMLILSPTLVLVFALTVPLSILITRFLATHSQPMFRLRSKKLGILNGFVEEMISGQQTIKIYNQEEDTIHNFDKINDDAMQSYYDAEYYGSLAGPSVNFVNNLSLTFISVLGALLFLKGNLSLGKLSSFVLYSRKFSGPINELANIFSDLQSSMAAAERIFRLLDEDPEVTDVPDAYVFEEMEGKVDLNHVHFGYTKDRTIIHDLSLEAQSGSLVAIVGPTGAGKTTIVSLLMRFYDPDSGTICIDDHDIKTATRKSLRKSYAMVLQDTWLFTGTVFENLAYGNETATREDIMEAAKVAHIHDFIMGLPKGYDTVIKEDGGAISQGQKQLMTIARAMLLEADILILDEATSNVDTQTEILIQDAMTSLMQDKTVFVIAHRLSTIRNADTILVVQNGDIVEKGTHDQLLAKNGAYAELYQSQFDE